MTRTADSTNDHPLELTGKQGLACKLHFRSVRTAIALSALSETFSGRKLTSILGGNHTETEGSRFSYWAAEPRDIFEFKPGQHKPFEKLAEALAKYRPANDGSDDHIGTALPSGIFRGGWIGYFGYELGRHIEKLPHTTVDELKMPLIRLCFHDRLIAYDHRAEVFWLLALELPGDRESPDRKLAALEAILDESASVSPIEPPTVDIERVDFSTIRSNIARQDYLAAINRAKRYIRDGEIYQVNLSQRFEQPFSGRPIDLFHWQNRHNASPYAAYIDTGDTQIVSASPEMFITLEEDWIQTQPIKGTRPRLKNDDPLSEAVNRRNLRDLIESEKERAELHMIVDLERNDLARICLPGTRSVIQPRTVAAYPTVFHALATIAGQLRPDVGLCGILRAVFPGGSITGAPKIRAMEIIEELEPTTRGVYTGSIGFIGLDGSVCLNIAIRTVIITAQMAYVQSGGGIVADSVSEAEWQETVTKARALLAGLNAAQRP